MWDKVGERRKNKRKLVAVAITITSNRIKLGGRWRERIQYCICLLKQRHDIMFWVKFFLKKMVS